MEKMNNSKNPDKRQIYEPNSKKATKNSPKRDSFRTWRIPIFKSIIYYRGIRMIKNVTNYWPTLFSYKRTITNRLTDDDSERICKKQRIAYPFNIEKIRLYSSFKRALSTITSPSTKTFLSPILKLFCWSIGKKYEVARKIIPYGRGVQASH